MLILFILQFQFRASQIFEILVHPRKHVKNRFLKRSIPVVKFENTFRQDSFIPLSDFIIQFRISRPFLRFLSSLSILSSIRSASRFSILLPAQFFSSLQLPETCPNELVVNSANKKKWKAKQ